MHGFYWMKEISIFLWQEVRDKALTRDQLDEIFFEASATRSFQDLSSRRAFRERWLGRYLENFSENFYVAQVGCEEDKSLEVAGYLAGCLVDPRDTDLFSDMSCFSDFSEHLEEYPAHLHINLAPAYRGAGLGARLMKVFLRDVKKSGLCGAHVVTGAASRNVSFYLGCGFQKIASSQDEDNGNVFLGIKV